MVGDLGGLPDQLVAQVLHGIVLGRFGAADVAEHGPYMAVGPGFLVDRESAAIVLGRHGDQGAALGGHVLFRRHLDGDRAGLAGFRLELEPVDRAADEPVAGRVEGIDEVAAFRDHGLGIRRRRDGQDRRVVRIELLLFDVVAGSGTQEDRCACSKKTYYLMFHNLIR